MPGPQGIRETRPIPRRLLSPAAEPPGGVHPVSAPVHTMRAGAEPYPGTPDRHRASQSSQTDAPVQSTPSHAYPDRQYVSASSHNHGQATPNRQNPPAETASCESILTNRRSERSSENQRMSPHTQHNTTAIQPSPTMPIHPHTHATTYTTRQNHHSPHHRHDNPHSTHAPRYTTRHINRQSTRQPHQPSRPACHDIHNPTQRRARARQRTSTTASAHAPAYTTCQSPDIPSRISQSASITLRMPCRL